jgi:hypothetical protein
MVSSPGSDTEAVYAKSLPQESVTAVPVVLMAVEARIFPANLDGPLSVAEATVTQYTPAFAPALIWPTRGR